MTPLATLLLFVGLLTLAFLLGAIRYWHDMRLHDLAWVGGPKYLTQSGGVPESIHPDLIVTNLSEVERQIIANAMYRGEDLPGVGPSFAD